MSSTISCPINIMLKLKPIAFGLLAAVTITACGSDDTDSPDTSDKKEPVSEIQIDKLALNYFENNTNSNFERVVRSQKLGSESKASNIRSYDPNANDESQLNGGFFDGGYEDDMPSAWSVFGPRLTSYSDRFEVTRKDTTLTFDMPDVATDNVEQYIVHYAPYDLTGHSVADSKAAKQKGIGLDTTFNQFDKLPDTLSFPEGSLCFAKTHQELSKPIFVNISYGAYLSAYESLDEWEAFIVSYYGDYDYAENSKVGSYNDHNARRLVYVNSDGKEQAHSMIEKGGLQSVFKLTSDDTIINTNPDKEKVDCSIVNDIAAEFLEEQIVKYY